VTERRAAGALLEDLRAVIIPWLTARALLVAGYLVAVAAADRLVPDGKPTALGEGLVAWDGTWYRDIAVHGYGGLPDEALRFFPLFPMLGKAFSIVTAGRVDVALVLIANVASLALAVAIRRLVRFERGNVALADRAVWMVCLFPGAFVLAWGYAEALWLLAAVVAFWGMRSRRWWWAAPACGAQPATRSASPGWQQSSHRSSGPAPTWHGWAPPTATSACRSASRGRCGATRSTRSAGSGTACAR
jgi:hypothetical protein